MSQGRIERWIEKKGYVWNCCIIARHYGKQLSAYDELFDELRKDFPMLNRNDVECLQAGGIRVAGRSMLRFQISAGSAVPCGWMATDGTVDELRP
jgi:hypothetical protein